MFLNHFNHTWVWKFLPLRFHLLKLQIKPNAFQLCPQIKNSYDDFWVLLNSAFIETEKENKYNSYFKMEGVNNHLEREKFVLEFASSHFLLSLFSYTLSSVMCPLVLIHLRSTCTFHFLALAHFLFNLLF